MFLKDNNKLDFVKNQTPYNDVVCSAIKSRLLYLCFKRFALFLVMLMMIDSVGSVIVSVAYFSVAAP